MVKTDKNPGGLLIDVFDGLRATRSPTARSSTSISRAALSSAATGRARSRLKGLISSFWRQGTQAGHKNALDCIKAFSQTDFTADLKKFNLPT